MDSRDDWLKFCHWLLANKFLPRKILEMTFSFSTIKACACYLTSWDIMEHMMAELDHELLDGNTWWQNHLSTYLETKFEWKISQAEILELKKKVFLATWACATVKPSIVLFILWLL